MAGDANEERSGGGLSDALRQAVEKTFAATAESRDRAQDLLAASGLPDMVERIRQIKDLEARVTELEKAVERLEGAEKRPEPKPEVET